MSKVWFITGANRGLGAEISRAVLEAGHRVIASARNSETLLAALGRFGDRLVALRLDVTQPREVEAAVAAAKQRWGRIDVLVNNAGYGQLGWFENTSMEQIRRQFETNVFGAMQVTRAILPMMRAQRSGHVFTISSIAGLVSVAGTCVYAASKFAVEGWMEGLTRELRPLGIAATVIEPGFFRTDFLDPTSVSYGEYDLRDYAEAAAEARARNDERNHRQAGDPAKLGAVLLKLADAAEPPVRFAAGTDAAKLVIMKAESLRSEAEKWRPLSASTDRHQAGAPRAPEAR